jgi:hypothetical protein
VWLRHDLETMNKRRLQEQATVGDGTVHRIAVECQRRFWTAAALGVR